MTMDPQAELREANVDVSRETVETLEQYVRLLRTWNTKINIVAPGTVRDAWSRHIVDSAQLFPMMREGQHWLDVGSGGGLPGLVVAILAKEDARDLEVTCVESDARKCAFMRTVARELKLPVQILRARVEELEPQRADVISARALTQLPGLLDIASRHLSDGGVALFPKGEKYALEVEKARERWTFRCEQVQSKTHPDAVVLKIGDLRRA